MMIHWTKTPYPFTLERGRRGVGECRDAGAEAARGVATGTVVGAAGGVGGEAGRIGSRR